MRTISADEVIQNIEFELLQSAVSHDDLGAGIQSVRQYQNRVREKLLDFLCDMKNGREIIIHLCQINEMLITVIQELNTALHALQIEVRKMARLAQVKALYGSAGQAAQAGLQPEEPTHARAIPVSDIERAMREEALHLELDLRPAAVPLIGGLVKKLKFALHDLVLFYTRQLAQKQTAVNRTYGEGMMYLIETCEQQRMEIDLLRARLAAVESYLEIRSGNTRSG